MKKCTKVLALALSAVLLSACQNPFDTDDDDDATKAYLLQYYLSQRSGSTSGSSDSESASSSDSSSTDSSSSNSTSENSSDSTSSDSNSSESSDSTSENADSTSESSNSTSDSTNSSESSSDGNGTSSENSSSNSSSADKNSSGASSENSSSENSGNSSSSSSSDGNSGDSSSSGASSSDAINYDAEDDSSLQNEPKESDKTLVENIVVEMHSLDLHENGKEHWVNHIVLSKLPGEIPNEIVNGNAKMYLGRWNWLKGKWEETGVRKFWRNDSQLPRFDNDHYYPTLLAKFNQFISFGTLPDYSDYLRVGYYYIRVEYNNVQYAGYFKLNLDDAIENQIKQYLVKAK